MCLRNAAMTLMINTDKSQVTCGREGRPPNSRAFSGAWGRVVGLALLVLSAMPSYAGPTAKFSKDLGSAVGSNSTVTVIVQYQQMPSSTNLKTAQSSGAKIGRKLPTINAVTMTIPASMLTALGADPNVIYVTPDRRISMTSTPVTEQFGTAVEADVAASQYALDGTGVSSGLANGYQAVYAGTAPNVNLVNLRVLDQYGFGTDSQVIAAIQQAIALQSIYNIRVINMSLGRPVFESYTLDPVDQAVEAAWKAGIVVVVAAGNNGRCAATNGYATIGAPGNDPAVITVGATLTLGTATRVDDTIASYSSKGPTAIDHIVKPDLVAPGNRLLSLRAAGSTLDATRPQNQVAPSSPSYGKAAYFVLSGTSMSTPVVSGAAALMLQKNPALTPDQVKARLMKSAWKGFSQYSWSTDLLGNVYNNEYDVFTYGAGYLDIDAALNNMDLANGLALSPTATIHPNGNVTIANTSSSAFGGTSVVWGSTSVVWGDSVVWGANTISSNSVVWGAQSVVWGATSVSGFSVVWGAMATTDSSTAALTNGDLGDK